MPPILHIKDLNNAETWKNMQEPCIVQENP